MDGSEERRLSSNSFKNTQCLNFEETTKIRKRESRASIFENVFQQNPDEKLVLSLFSNIAVDQESYKQISTMVDQEVIIALTRHVRNFSDALNNLRSTFRDSLIGSYNFLFLKL